MNKQNYQDHYFKKAQKAGYPARSVYKLQEIDNKFKLIKKNDQILDLGCVPGSWLLYLSKKVGEQGAVLGIDKQDIKINLPDNTSFRKKDIKDIVLKNQDNKFDVVVSDMAPKTTGVRVTDAARSLDLSQLAFNVAQKVLKQEGNFLVKAFESQEAHNFSNNLKQYFQFVKNYTPKATRKKSRELYIIAKNFNGK